MTASPISDVNPLLMAADAQLLLQSASAGERVVPMASFFVGYRKVDMRPDEVLVSVTIPWCRESEYFEAYVALLAPAVASMPGAMPSTRVKISGSLAFRS